MFPQSYTRVVGLRQDLKIHHFDLLNTMKDVENLAKSTKFNFSRSIRKLNLRKKYEMNSKLSPSLDEKIWSYEIKYNISDL